MDTFQFADIIILALIAGFIALRLRSTLGKDVGHRPDSTQLRRQMGKELDERVVTLPTAKAAKEEPKPEKDKAFDKLEGKMQEKIQAIKDVDPTFNLSEFMEGARGAFEWVMKAYNDGDKTTLKQLLNKEVYTEFEEAMIDRMSSPTRAHTTLVAIDEISLQEAETKGSKTQITVKYLTDQIHVVKNEKEEVISGNPSEITHVEDEWVFERPLKSRDPNWTIIDT